MSEPNDSQELDASCTEYVQKYRLQHGQCINCGNQTHERVRKGRLFRKTKLVPIESRHATNGICLFCHPTSSRRSVADKLPSNKQDSDEKSVLPLIPPPIRAPPGQSHLLTAEEDNLATNNKSISVFSNSPPGTTVLTQRKEQDGRTTKTTPKDSQSKTPETKDASPPPPPNNPQYEPVAAMVAAALVDEKCVAHPRPPPANPSYCPVAVATPINDVGHENTPLTHEKCEQVILPTTQSLLPNAEQATSLNSIFDNVRRTKELSCAQNKSNTWKRVYCDNKVNESDPTVHRWKTFLSKIVKRHGNIISEAKVGVTSLINEEVVDYDDTTNSVPILNSLKAIEIRLIELRRKLGDTFYAKMSPLEQTDTIYEKEVVKLKEVTLNLEHDYHRFRCKALGDFYRRLWPVVEKALSEEVYCSRCNQNLELENVVQPRTISCNNCKTVNHVGPHAVVANYYSMAPDGMAEEECIEKRIAIEQFKSLVDLRYEQHRKKCQHGGSCGTVQGCNRESKQAEEDWTKLEAMERDYWQSYVRARSKFQPVGSDKLTDHYIESRMMQWKMSSPLN